MGGNRLFNAIRHFNASKLKIDPQREETRGIFALGVIAALVGVRFFPELQENTLVLFFINWITIYWGAYAFLMAIAITNEDWINPTTAKWCYVLAQCAFIVGAMMIPALVCFYLVISIPYVRIVLPLAVAAVTGLAIGPHRGKHNTNDVTQERRQGQKHKKEGHVIRQVIRRKVTPKTTR